VTGQLAADGASLPLIPVPAATRKGNRTIAHPLSPGDEVMIVAAISGG
jgi:hypothetical protein